MKYCLSFILTLLLTCLAGIIDTYGQYEYRKAVVEVKKINRKKSIITKIQILGALPGGKDTAEHSIIKRNFNTSNVCYSN